MCASHAQRAWCVGSGSPLGFEEELVELLQEQLVEEVRVYLADLRAAMVATAGKRKSRQKEPHVRPRLHAPSDMQTPSACADGACCF